MRNSEFLYLLVIDLVHLGMPLSGEDTIVDIYNRREPKYINAWLQAYQYALAKITTSLDVTPELLLGIQKNAASHYLHGDKIGYSYGFESFTTIPQQMGKIRIPNYCHTIEGIEDFIHYWFIEAPLGRMHKLIFCDGRDNTSHILRVASYDKDTDSFKINDPVSPRGREVSRQELLTIVTRLSKTNPGEVIVERNKLTKETIEGKLELLCSSLINR